MAAPAVVSLPPTVMPLGSGSDSDVLASVLPCASSSSIASLSLVSSVAAPSARSASSPSPLCLRRYSDLDLVDLVTALLRDEGVSWESLPGLFKGMLYNVRPPHVRAGADVDPDGVQMLCFNYLDSNRRWRDRWALQTRGTVIMRHGDSVHCIKSLLPRGSELLCVASRP